MIAYIKGELAEKTPAKAIIEAGGVGYEILIPVSTYDSLPRTGEEAKLLICHVIREDDEILFGFGSKAEKEMFIKLTSVSGVGPKSALAIISGSSIGDLSLAISTGNSKRISSIKGIGKKTAEKICIELKDKVNAIEALASANNKGGNANAPIIRDAILALTALGFSEENANIMVSKAITGKKEIPNAETIIRLALSS